MSSALDQTNGRSAARRGFPPGARLGVALLLVVFLGITQMFSNGAAAGTSEAEGVTTLDGVFTAAQVERAASIFSRQCASCHGNELGGSALAPPLQGLAFMVYWQGKTLGELFSYARENMPLGEGGTLSDRNYADLVALILAANGFPAGEAELGPNVESLAQVEIAPAPSDEGGE